LLVTTPKIFAVKRFFTSSLSKRGEIYLAETPPQKWSRRDKNFF
jgi:hypothetical protein